MTPDAHLDLILAHCRKLLDIASNRTPGGWVIEVSPSLEKAKEDGGFDWCSADVFKGPVASVWLLCESGGHTGLPGSIECSESNAAFIASAAGNFESALRTTIASCELAKAFCKPVGSLSLPARDFINNILAAWPVERVAK